ncbi:MAG: glycosyltransferase family 9 protein [Oligoflexia bacterium]|nr:glycosyltransferase family 9 protein [Oligoflexia bacterium]
MKNSLFFSRTSDLAKSIDRYVGVGLILFMALLSPLHKMLRGRRRSEASILVLKISALGDLVVMLPAIRRIRRHYPQSEIHFFGGPSTLEIASSLNEFSKVGLLNLKSVIQLFREDYELVVDFDQWSRFTALMALIPRAKRRVGFRSPNQFRHYAFDQVYDLDFSKHMGRNFWNLVGVGLSGLEEETAFTDDIHSCAQSRRKAPVSKGAVILHPGCGAHGSPRQWPIELWIQLIADIKAIDPAIPIVTTGAGDVEQGLVSKLAEKGAQPLMNLSISELTKVLSESSVVVTGNTGVMHLASLVNGRVLGLHGPTSEVLWGPLFGGQVIRSSLSCSPCLTWGHDYGCSDAVCMKVIRPKQVAMALKELYA